MNKVVLITGASSGIGNACAKLFLTNGYTVINASRRKSEDTRVVNFEVDVSNTKEIDELINKINDKYSRIDILINCAGFSMAAPIEDVLESDYRYLFDVNLFAAIYLIKKVVTMMKNLCGGRIINISSIGAFAPIPYDPYYSASKAALNMLTLALAIELRNDAILLSSIMPGGTKTPFTFVRKVYELNNRNLENAVAQLAKIEQEGMSAESVASVVYKTATANRPPLIVCSGIKNKLIYVLSKILPHKIFNYFIKLMFKIK